MPLNFYVRFLRVWCGGLCLHPTWQNWGWGWIPLYCLVVGIAHQFCALSTLPTGMRVALGRVGARRDLYCCWQSGTTLSPSGNIRVWMEKRKRNGVCVCVCVLVSQYCLILCDPTDLPGSSGHRILQARILEWGTIPFSRGSSWPRDWTWTSCIAGRFFTLWATRFLKTSLFCKDMHLWWRLHSAYKLKSSRDL